jgi:hypothetical protein
LDEVNAGGSDATATDKPGSNAGGSTQELARPWGSNALRVVLAALGGLGIFCILAWAAFWAVFDLNGPDPRDTSGFELYLDVAQAWAVGVGLLGICRVYGRRWTIGGSPVAWLFWCDLGLLFAALWPVQALIGAVLYARRARRRSRRLRALAALAGVGVLFGGGAWAVTAYAAEQPWLPAHVTTSPFLGTWKGPDGATLVIRQGGVFLATGFAQNGVDGYWPQQLIGRGSWTLSHESGSQTLTLTPVPPDGDVEHNATLDIYGRFSPSTLCLALPGPYDPCVLALHR